MVSTLILLNSVLEKLASSNYFVSFLDTRVVGANFFCLYLELLLSWAGLFCKSRWYLWAMSFGEPWLARVTFGDP